MSLTLQPLTTPDQLESFAAMMLSTESWITIHRTQEDTVKLLANPIRINPKAIQKYCRAKQSAHRIGFKPMVEQRIISG